MQSVDCVGFVNSYKAVLAAREKRRWYYKAPGNAALRSSSE